MPEPDSNLPYALGIDVGVTQIKIARVTPDGRVLERGSIDTRADDAEWPRRVRDLVTKTETTHGPAAALGLAAPGIASSEGTRIAWMQCRLDAVQGLNWTRFLDRSSDVPVLNDAQAALLGEAWIGAAAGVRNVTFISLGTGVGGALMVDGHLLRGHLGRAGHLGHLCLDVDGDLDIVNTPGSLEHFVGNATVWARSGGRFQSTHDLVAAHEAGDADATQLWLRTIHYLAAGLVSLINIADPERVIVGGGIAAAGQSLFHPLQALLDRWEWRPHDRRVSVVPATLGEHAGAIGAARNAIQFNSHRPRDFRNEADATRCNADVQHFRTK